MHFLAYVLINESDGDNAETVVKKLMTPFSEQGGENPNGKWDCSSLRRTLKSSPRA
jgi:hypothetical protein